MTTRHRTRHLVGIRVPIFDTRYDGITKDIFVQSSPIKELDGFSVADHMIKLV